MMGKKQIETEQVLEWADTLEKLLEDIRKHLDVAEEEGDLDQDERLD